MQDERANGQLEQVTGRRTIFWAFIALVLVGLISGTIFGAGKWPGLGPDDVVVVITPQSTLLIATTRLPSTAAQSSSASPLATESPTGLPTTVATTATPTFREQPTATSLAPTPTTYPPVRSVPPDYPVLANRYDGTISDQFSFPFRNTSMTLSQLHQDGEKISGYFSSGSDVIGTGSFSGTLSSDKLVQFILPGDTLLHSFFFQGQLQEDGSILGTYCSLQNNHCNFFAGEYGNWKVMPLSG